ncbi:hypothetical protein NQZ68_000782 [Dissostichus eleginoides]|nr:hypothetical protein NQZ68_000782 [Dissostichus eleginoides]
MRNVRNDEDRCERHVDPVCFDKIILFPHLNMPFAVLDLFFIRIHPLVKKPRHMAGSAVATHNPPAATISSPPSKTLG